MNSNRELFDPERDQRQLSEMLLETVRFVPLLTALLAIGLLAAYGLSRSGMLGEPSWQMLAIAGSSLLAGLLQMPIVLLARRGRGYLALGLFMLVLSLWAASLVLVAENSLAIAIIIVWAAPFAALAARSDRRVLVASAVAGLSVVAALVWLNSSARLPRLLTANPAGLASLALTASTILLFILGTTIVRIFRYRSVQSRLIVSFVLIITIPILFTTAISASTAFTNSETQFNDSLQAITSLKQGETERIVRTMWSQMSDLQQGSMAGASLVHVLYPAGQSEEAYRMEVSGASTTLRNLMVRYPASQYEEVALLDVRGNVVLTTYELDHGLPFADQAFFQQGLKGFYGELMKWPGKQNFAGEYKIVVSAPLYGQNQQDIRGVIVTVADSDVLAGITGPTVGLTSAKTYLVGRENTVILGVPGSQPAVTAWPIVHIVLGRQGQETSNYTNYLGVSVLGYAAWDPNLNAVMVAEMPRSVVYAKALSSLLVNGLIGLFAIVAAVIAALSTSQAISKPIHSLAGTAGTLSTGDLTARAAPGGQDEVGHLALSFNNMADQLQSLIGNLEQRVAERTDALEQQTLRLRTAAEVARDAASAPELDALLDQAARLIMERFGFYHAGIFLVDDKHEFAVLRASPSEAGQQMLANKHMLRLGEQGLVGRVAATGEPRIALDTGVDSVYFSNPLLPRTHSEMALPLKTPAGTIGVIDIQSDQPEAFTQDDIAIVQVMADQLATAIQRTQLLQQVQAQLDQLEQSQQTFTKQTWETFAGTGRPNVGYRFDNVRLEPIRSGNGHAAPAPRPPATRAESGAHTMDVPVRLRGQTIGIVTLRFQGSHVPETTTRMIQQIADRLATALENARLLEDSMHRANRERAIGEISSKISASVNMRNVLQTAVEELGRAIPGSDVVIQFRPDTEI